MNLAPIIARLVDQCPEFFSIESATGVNTIEREGYPCAGVHPLSEHAKGGTMVPGCIKQEVTVEFGVLIAAHAMEPTTGLDPLEDARGSVSAALLGYKRPEWLDPIEFVAGDIIAIESSKTLWRDIYRTRILYTAQITRDAT
jgi:hypothetical protein